MEKELIVLLNGSGQRTGSAPKLESHHSDTPLHLGFSCYIFNQDGLFLLTRRALSKKVWPGVWTNSVCGHPSPNEDPGNAVRRRALYELGLEISDINLLLPDYSYKTPPFNGIVENEICPVFTATTLAEPLINPDEVEQYKWIKWNDYVTEAINKPDNFSYWAKDQLKHLSDNEAIIKLIKK